MIRDTFKGGIGTPILSYIICQYAAAEEAIYVLVSDSESEEEEREPIDIVVVQGQVVLVELKVARTRGKRTLYVARIMEDTLKKTDEVQVQFLRKTSNSKIISFVYPTQTAIALVALEDLLAKLKVQKTATWQVGLFSLLILFD